MSEIRKHHSASFKLKVALAAIREDATLDELALRFGAHRSQVGKWESLLENEGESLFEDKQHLKHRHAADSTTTLYEKIGQLTQGRDFLAKTSHYVTK